MSSLDSSSLSQLQPHALWEIFSQITQIPRPSKKEAGMTKFAKEFGEKLGLETIVDEVGNVIIKKPATPGMENRKGVILQAHMDMVPQKNSDVVHDFEKDPIQAYIDGEWVTAKGTTLGADNGIGVAAILAILKDDNVKHGPIEALLTVDEEAGMTGAFGLKPGMLEGKMMLNLDSEDEGEFCVGCAGGLYSDIDWQYQEERVDADVAAFKINVSGLRGGHSGMDISLQRANANKLLNRFLWEAAEKHDLRLSEFDCGDLPNAIPREAIAIVTVASQQANDFEKFAAEFLHTVKHEYAKADPDINIKVSKTDMPNKVMNKVEQTKLLNAIFACMNGVYTMSLDMPGLTEASSNMARVLVKEGRLEILFLHRSPVASIKQMIANMIKATFALIGATSKQHGGYPGWEPNVESSVLAICQKIHKDKFGHEAKVFATHGGLECGLIGSLYPGLESISFGPTIRYPHSPDEKVNIATVGRFWELLVAVIENIPA